MKPGSLKMMKKFNKEDFDLLPNESCDKINSEAKSID